MTYAMTNLLWIAEAVRHGQLDLEGATRVEVGRQEVSTYGEGSKYLDYAYVDSERLGYDDYSFELTPAEYTVKEVIDYINGPYKADLEAYNKDRQAAVALVAQLTENVQGTLSEILAVAKKYDIPANIKVGGRTNDFRLIDAVDWDSSSMYC